LADRYRWAAPLTLLMRSMTQREYEVRMAWLNREAEPLPSDLPKEEVTRVSKSNWFGALGIKKES
jgi:hypothetical protein